MPDLGLAWLLDKSVVRRAAEGISASLAAAPLTVEQSLALRLLRRGAQTSALVLITPETANILLHRAQLLAVRLLLNDVTPIRRGRYFSRWARRLRESGFTREDALVLSYGTFGLSSNGLILGVSAVVTFDRPMIHNFEAQQAKVFRRLTAMAAQLPSPYSDAALPRVLTPDDLLATKR
ncbi:MAG: hypothetical protein FJ011_20810 [Chloroflexi bacterium]|nr:hypothetical protein [Chloroflexota bacterium]